MVSQKNLNILMSIFKNFTNIYNHILENEIIQIAIQQDHLIKKYVQQISLDIQQILENDPDFDSAKYSHSSKIFFKKNI